MIQFSIRLPKDLYETIEKIAGEKEQSKVDIIRELIESGLSYQKIEHKLDKLSENLLYIFNNTKNFLPAQNRNSAQIVQLARFLFNDDEKYSQYVNAFKEMMQRKN